MAALAVLVAAAGGAHARVAHCKSISNGHGRLCTDSNAPEGKRLTVTCAKRYVRHHYRCLAAGPTKTCKGIVNGKLCSDMAAKQGHKVTVVCQKGFRRHKHRCILPGPTKICHAIKYGQLCSDQLAKPGHKVTVQCADGYTQQKHKCVQVLSDLTLEGPFDPTPLIGEFLIDSCQASVADQSAVASIYATAAQQLAAAGQIDGVDFSASQATSAYGCVLAPPAAKSLPQFPMALVLSQFADTYGPAPSNDGGERDAVLAVIGKLLPVFQAQIHTVSAGATPAIQACLNTILIVAATPDTVLAAAGKGLFVKHFAQACRVP